MNKTLNDFYNNLGASESGGRYDIVNKYGYLGKYQMGEAAMIDAGYYAKTNNNYNNDWSGKFTGKDGVYSVQDFLNNPKAQENAQMSFKRAQWNQLKAVGADKYLGKVINGVEVTQSGLLAAAHLKGPGAVKEYLESNGKNIPKDAFGTSVEIYMKKHGGFDVSKITGLPSDSNLNGQTETIVKNKEIDNIYSNNSTKPFEIGIEYNEYLNKEQNFWDNIPFADPVKDNQINELTSVPDHQFTRQEIGRMTPEEFQANESIIMEQLEKGRILDEKVDYDIQFPHGCYYTREDIAKMSSKEYRKHEKDILKQMKKQGIPSEKDLPKGEKSRYSKSQSFGGLSGTNSGSEASDGHWVTINGNHVLIDD